MKRAMDAGCPCWVLSSVPCIWGAVGAPKQGKTFGGVDGRADVGQVPPSSHCSLSTSHHLSSATLSKEATLGRGERTGVSVNSSET